MITTQQKISGISTDCAPAITTMGDQDVVAWTNNDGTISWTTLKVNSSGDGYDVGKITASGFTGTQGYSPALTTLDGTVWMAWLGDPAQAPTYITASGELRQPPVIMAASLSGSTWSKAEALWNPGLSGGDNFVTGYQGPSAISAPAIVANGSGLMAMWIENAVDGSDALALWYEGQPASPAPQPQIFFATWTKAAGWSKRAPIKDALSYWAPALAAYKGTVSMAFKGENSSDIYFAQYTDAKGWGDHAKLPGFQSATGVALAYGDTGNLHLVWVEASASSLFTSTIPPSVTWSSSSPGTGWTAEVQMPVIESGLPPALASQPSSTSAVTLAAAGVSSVNGVNDHDVYVVPMTAFAAVGTPVFGIGSNSNFIFANDDKALKSVSVTIDLSEAIVLSRNGPPEDGLSAIAGFSFQLNCYSPKAESGVWPTEASAWQQYVIGLNNTQLSGQINNWPLPGPDPAAIPSYLTDQEFSLTSVPNANVLPSGYKLIITLQNKTDGTVTGARYQVIDNGKTLADVSQAVSLSAQDLSPIIAFEFNIVGPGQGEEAYLSSGKGKITYSVEGTMTAWSEEPAYAESSYFTGETANTTYGPLTGYPVQTVGQTFGVTPLTTPMIHKKIGKLLKLPRKTGKA